MARTLTVEIPAEAPILKKLKLEYMKAANTELRSRYTYWLQGMGSFEDLTTSIDRYHDARANGIPMADTESLLAEKLNLAKRIEKQAGIIYEKKRSAEYAIAPKAAKTYRLRIEIEIARRQQEK